MSKKLVETSTFLNTVILKLHSQQQLFSRINIYIRHHSIRWNSWDKVEIFFSFWCNFLMFTSRGGKLLEIEKYKLKIANSLLFKQAIMVRLNRMCQYREILETFWNAFGILTLIQMTGDDVVDSSSEQSIHATLAKILGPNSDLCIVCRRIVLPNKRNILNHVL